MSKDKKAKVDINSVHSKLAGKYKIKRDINTKVSSSIKDFKSENSTPVGKNVNLRNSLSKLKY